MNNQVSINFKKLGIFINNDFIPFSNNNVKEMQEDPETMILETTLLNSLKESESVDEFIEMYISKNDEMKYMKIEPVKINLKSDAKIIQSKQFPIPFKFKDPMRAEIKRLLNEDIIVECDSVWSSPGFGINKKSGEIILVIDYRKVNENIIDDVITLPKILENLMTLGKNKIYSKIDLKNGFNQLILHEDSRPITGFVVENKQYCYKRVPFGLKSGPKIFQRNIEKILKDIEGVLFMWMI
jgi:hypothetical protein